MNDAFDPSRPILGQLLWSADPATQSTILFVLGAAATVLVFVYAPLIVRLIRIMSLERAVRAACRLDGRPGEAHRDEIAAAFRHSPLDLHWEEFAYRWRNSLTEGEKQRAPVRMIDVFDERPLIPTGPRRSLLPALPGLFLAVGVLGTFIGLAGAIGLSGGPANAAGGVSAQVAQAVALALGASLWGLLLAIGAVVGGRLLEGSFDRLAEALDHSVERAFGAVSEGELLSLATHAQRESVVQLGTELTRFTGDLTERIDRGLTRIEHSTANAATLVSEEQRGALQSVVRELSVQVQTGVEQHLTALHEMLDRAVDHQGAVTGGLAEAFDQMAENAQVHDRVTQTLEQAAFAVQGAASQMSATAHDFSPVLDQLRETGTALSHTATTMQSTEEVVARTAEGIRGSIEHATSALFEQREFIETGLGEVRSTLELMSTGLGENLNQALRNVDEALDRTVGRLRETIEDSNETIDRMSAPVRAAEGTTREMQTALERVRGEIVGLGEWLGQAVKPVRTSLGQLEDRAGEVTRALAQFGDHAQHVDKTMDALRSEIHEEGRRFRSSTAELGRHLQVAADTVGSVQDAERTGPRAGRADPAPAADPRPVSPPVLPPVPPRPAPEPRAMVTRPSAPPSRPAPTAPAPQRSGPPAKETAPDNPALPAAPVEAEGPRDEPSPPPIVEREPEGAAPSPLARRGRAAPTAAGAADSAAPADPPAATKKKAKKSKKKPNLGPDPYARPGDQRASLERQQRILESGRTMHRLEVDDPRRTAVQPDEEQALSGLLSKHRTTGSEPADVSDEADDAPTADAVGDERPRTWRLLGKD